MVPEARGRSKGVSSSRKAINTNTGHMSLLYGLFPGYEITPDRKDLFAAAHKLTGMRGFFEEGISWALASVTGAQ